MPSSPQRVIIRNARQHNLKGITVELPRRALTVITGPSGSGKSSLAFDTLYAEGQRRYIESLPEAAVGPSRNAVVRQVRARGEGGYGTRGRG